jgi:hypothetical protein
MLAFVIEMVPLISTRYEDLLPPQQVADELA